MRKESSEKSFVPVKAGTFILDVFRSFRRNQGLLLSGAVAYYTLLSLVPMLALILVLLSHFVEEEKLFQTVVTHLDMLIPSYSDVLSKQVLAFFKHRQVIGGIGFLIMLFFSSMAFTVLENAMSVIFYHRVKIHRRHFVVSAIIPYAYILFLAVGALLVSFIAGSLGALEKKTLIIFGLSFSLEGSTGIGLYIMGITGLVLMLTSLYMVMPVGRITFRHALIGGVTATILWEITRHILVWYFSTLSLVNVIYGSLATAVVFLLSIEIASIILLLGAQVISEFERNSGKFDYEEQSGFET